MELQTFDEDTLIQLITGVKSAADRASALGAKINPILPRNDAARAVQKLSLFRAWDDELGDMVEFDLAITVSESKADRSTTTGSAKGGVNIHVVSAAIGGAKESESRTELRDTRISRVKFRVPVVLPHVRPRRE